MSTMPEIPFTSVIPALRSDVLMDRGELDAVAWSPTRERPFYLDPVATLLLDIFDGLATIGDVAADVADVVGIDESSALSQVARTLSLYNTAGLLMTEPAEPQLAPIDHSAEPPDH